jgi:hypothetical protein
MRLSIWQQGTIYLLSQHTRTRKSKASQEEALSAPASSPTGSLHRASPHPSQDMRSPLWLDNPYSRSSSASWQCREAVGFGSSPCGDCGLQARLRHVNHGRSPRRSVTTPAKERGWRDIEISYHSPLTRRQYPPESASWPDSCPGGDSRGKGLWFLLRRRPQASLRELRAHLV